MNVLVQNHPSNSCPSSDDIEIQYFNTFLDVISYPDNVTTHEMFLSYDGSKPVEKRIELKITNHEFPGYDQAEEAIECFEIR